jgi:hypothetical protein
MTKQESRMNIIRRNILLTAVAGITLAYLPGLAAQAAETRKQPNVILILADDLGYGELGCYGSPDAKTPNMDQLAKDGVRCTDGYAAFPVCLLALTRGSFDRSLPGAVRPHL